MRGFSIIEIIVTTAIFSILVGLGVFMSVGAFRGSIHRSEDATIVSLLQRARSRAMANVSESEWSVCYIAPNYIIAKGASCTVGTARDKFEANAGVAADSEFDTTFPTIVFEQLTGNTTPEEIVVKQGGREPVKISTNHAGTIIW